MSRTIESGDNSEFVNSCKINNRDIGDVLCINCEDNC